MTTLTYTDAALNHFTEHLGHRRASPWHDVRARVVRRVAMHIAQGATGVIAGDRHVIVHCTEGSLWITQDGDPRDVFLETSEDYRAERRAPMHVHALKPCVVEVEFDDGL